MNLHPDRSRRDGRIPAALLLVLVVGSALAVTACGAEQPVGTAHPRPAPGLGVLLDRAGSDPTDPAQETIARLDPALRSALADATAAARADGIRLEVNSGWRSRAHQQRLLDEAVARYGSLDAALEYVATPEASAHVTGDAVDIGPADAADWLGRHGSAYGLCRIFANEDWHFELATTPGGDCPPTYADASAR